ncbi:endonuclease V [Kribbella sp. ALI-6-A]|uniref:endonuclease V n=1 Tax=Kribbella sp. ALI-6-A TaxID=1933817 RepID=UPI001EDB3084|nr:endonuclease V [Kribbella sp. ALI-6-A]
MHPSVDEAIAIQERLRAQVDAVGPGPQHPRYVAGLDVAYDGDEYAAAVVVLEVLGRGDRGSADPGSADPRPVELREVDRAVVRGRTSFPYVPGLFAFREVPGLLAALDRLQVTPDLLVCDGQGLAHPRRFGLACHLGVVTGLPSIGVAKTAFVGDWDEPGPLRGNASDLVLDGDVVGKVLRTQNKTKPVFVSVGHRVSLATAVERVLELAPRYRLPETTRAADRACRDGLVAR